MRVLHTYSWSIILITQQDFRCRVCQRSTTGCQLFPRLKFVTESKVGELDQPLFLEEHHILWLEVPVHHMQPMAVGDSMDNLGKIFLSQLFIQTLLMFHDVVKHIPSIAQLQDEVKLGLSVYHFIQAHNIGVLDQLHAADFLEKVACGHGVQLSLVDHLHRHFLASEDMAGQLDNGKVAAAQRLVQVIEASDLAIIAPLEACHSWRGQWGEGSPRCRQGQVGRVLWVQLSSVHRRLKENPWLQLPAGCNKTHTIRNNLNTQ